MKETKKIKSGHWLTVGLFFTAILYVFNAVDALDVLQGWNLLEENDPLFQSMAYAFIFLGLGVVFLVAYNKHGREKYNQGLTEGLGQPVRLCDLKDNGIAYYASAETMEDEGCIDGAMGKIYIFTEVNEPESMLVIDFHDSKIPKEPICFKVVSDGPNHCKINIITKNT